MVEIPNCPRPGETQYGYVFFDKSVRTPGPVRRVSKVNTSTSILVHLKERLRRARLVQTLLSNVKNYHVYVRNLSHDLVLP